MKLLIIIISAISLFLYNAASAEKSTIAIIDFQPNGFSASRAKAVTELIQSEIVKSDKYTVLERARMDQILKEVGFQQTGCTEVSCAVKLGNMLSARKIVIGSVIRAGNKMIISGRIVDVKKGISEYAAQESVEYIEDLDKAVVKLVEKLTDEAKPELSLADFGWKCVKGNCVEGEGKAEHPKGRKYTGEFKNGAFDGHGTIEYGDETMYVGNFKNGMYDGYGTYYYKTEWRYVGYFKNNKFHGQGAIYDKNGNILEEGKYENDKLQGCCLMFWNLQ